MSILVWSKFRYFFLILEESVIIYSVQVTKFLNDLNLVIGRLYLQVLLTIVWIKIIAIHCMPDVQLSFAGSPIRQIHSPQERDHLPCLQDNVQTHGENAHAEGSQRHTQRNRKAGYGDLGSYYTINHHFNFHIFYVTLLRPSDHP